MIIPIIIIVKVHTICMFSKEPFSSLLYASIWLSILIFSCTLDAYHKILSQCHLNSGYDVKELLSYDKLKNSWYAFLDLLNVTSEEGSMCQDCQQYPEIIICDGTGLSFQRKFAAQNMEVPTQKPFKKFS